MRHPPDPPEANLGEWQLRSGSVNADSGDCAASRSRSRYPTPPEPEASRGSYCNETGLRRSRPGVNSELVPKILQTNDLAANAQNDKAPCESSRALSFYFQSSKFDGVKRHVLQEMFLSRFQIETLPAAQALDPLQQDYRGRNGPGLLRPPYCPISRACPADGSTCSCRPAPLRRRRSSRYLCRW